MTKLQEIINEKDLINQGGQFANLLLSDVDNGRIICNELVPYRELAIGYNSLYNVELGLTPSLSVQVLIDKISKRLKKLGFRIQLLRAEVGCILGERYYVRVISVSDNNDIPSEHKLPNSVELLKQLEVLRNLVIGNSKTI